MRLRCVRVAAIVLSVALTLPVAPLAFAGPRDSDRDLPSKIVTIIKKLQKFIGIGTHDEPDEQPIPPRP